LGRVWLWRIDLNDHGRVWHMAMPPKDAQQIATWTREVYEERVQRIQPLPGFDLLPCKLSI
ncbi:hypothetical protein, partial [Chromobacterium vaccinii]|uniref:hypothetical protein n=1 Tax=Chromobacterium vaccinii TaxID=1108595 RepID=UPI001F263C1C